MQSLVDLAQCPSSAATVQEAGGPPHHCTPTSSLCSVQLLLCSPTSSLMCSVQCAAVFVQPKPQRRRKNDTQLIRETLLWLSPSFSLCDPNSTFSNRDFIEKEFQRIPSSTFNPLEKLGGARGGGEEGCNTKDGQKFFFGD